MRKILLGIIFLSSLLFSVEWKSDLKSAFEQAKADNKVVMVMVEMKHCTWCEKMKDRTMLEDDVVIRLKKYIPVKVMNTDANALGLLPYIDGVPSVFFMSPKQELLESIVGYRNVREFNKYLDVVEKKFTTSKPTQQVNNR